MLVSCIMRTPVTTIGPGTSVRAAAALMAKLDLGVLPVCENGRPVGILTDRDIVIRWVPEAVADRHIAPIMTPAIVTCRVDQTVEQAAYVMSAKQIRRLVVVDDAGNLVGIISVDDIANDASEELAGQTLGEIVEVR
ncbi:CBS domain-containing protein [Aliiroseovarius sp. S1339]|uniref:CBS domain-containing protein n=1 Tax=Aliiroseovarius sp. S1339 TaxID=2936990 RepID=UPI0020BF331A|nr:CBS domain-containing protein [Aliiroseovarius sp. S1339]MCK8465519.1 CBS domain-containing protein [Aliiroseovarius sp. S1339]